MELTAEVLVLDWDGGSGNLTPRQRISTDAPRFDGERSAAEIWVSPDGAHVYCSNRGDHTIVSFSVDDASGELRLENRTASGGQLPWSFAVHPGGRWMAVANLGSDSVDLLRLDERGALQTHGSSASAPKPGSLLWVELE